MPKVLFIRSTPYDEDLNGYNVQGVGIAKAFCILGYDCDYLNFHKTRNETVRIFEYNGRVANVIFRNRIRLFRTGLNFEVLDKEFLNSYDIIICREYNQLMTYLVAKRHNNTSMYSGPYWNMFMIPFVSGVYDLLFTRKLNSILQKKFVKSEMAKQFLEDKGYTDLINVGVGLDTSRFKDVRCSDGTKDLVQFMHNNNCLLYVGTLDENKNIPFIIRVFEKLLIDHPSLKLVLIGKSHQSVKNKLMGKRNESYFEDLMSETSEKTKQAIVHVERIENPQLQFIYPLASAFILPSIHEIFGMVMLEAMYFGAPVVTSKNGGSTTLIRSEKYGIMIDNYDVDCWTQGINRLINEPSYRDTVIRNSKELIENEYTWVSVAKKMLDCINT